MKRAPSALITEGTGDMGRKRRIDDEGFRFLLKSYERPGLDAEALDRIFELGSREGAGQAAIRPSSRGRFRPLAWAPIAAGILIVAGLTAFASLSSARLPAPYVVYRSGAEEAPRMAGGIVDSKGDGLRVHTETEELFLAKDSRLRIAASPWPRFRGATGNLYYLERGSLYLEHASLPGRGDFALVLPWGRARPAGTSLSCRVDGSGAELYCLSGGLSFASASRREYAIAQGMVLVIRDDGKRIELRHAEPADKPFMPAATDAALAARSVEAPAPISAPAQAPGPSRPLVELWSLSLGAKPSDILVDGARVIVLFPGELWVLDARDGRRMARAAPAGGIEAYALDADRLFLYAKAVLRRLELPGLDEAWSEETGNLAFTRFAIAGSRLYLPSAEGKLYIHELEHGRLVGTIGAGTGLYGRPLVEDGRIILSTLDRRLLAFALEDGRKLWEYRAEGRFVDDRPVALGDLIVDYTKEGKLFALDARSGALAWESPASSAPAGGLARWGRSLAYVDGRGAHRVGPDGAEEELSGRTVVDLAVGEGDDLYLAGTEGIERLTRDGARSRLSSSPFVLIRGGPGTLAAVDADSRLILYREGR
jgi:hypothetical protein